MKLSDTARGFYIGYFTDRYGQECSIQESSLATENCIWLGVNNTGPQLKGPVCEDDYNQQVMVRMHLTVDNVKELLPYLIRFVETGSLTDE